MGLVDRRPVVGRNRAMGFWVPLHFSRPLNSGYTFGSGGAGGGREDDEDA